MMEQEPAPEAGGEEEVEDDPQIVEKIMALMPKVNNADKYYALLKNVLAHSPSENDSYRLKALNQIFGSTIAKKIMKGT